MRHYVFEEKDEYGFLKGTYSGHIRNTRDYLVYGTKSYHCRSAAEIEIACALRQIESK